MRLIDADAFDRDLCNHKFTAALNEAADAGTAFEDKEMYYSTQSFRDVMKYRPTIEAVPLDKLCECLAGNRIEIPCKCCKYYLGDAKCSAISDMTKPCPNTADEWRYVLTKWMEELDAAD